MDSFFLFVLFIFWVIFWSFASVIIYRLKSWEKWIWTWRSHCTKCNHTLGFLDLIPIFSYIFTLWKCKYCKIKISFIYPILEISMWLLFFFIWYFLIDFYLIIILDTLEITKLLFYLIIGFLSIVYTFYDILFLEIHEKILWIWVFLSLIVLSIQTLFPSFQIITFLPVMQESINIWIFSIISSFLIVWILYIVMIKWLKEIYDVILIISIIIFLYIFKVFFSIDFSEVPILWWMVWALWIFTFFFMQILISSWKWMWWWDLRIALFIWLILWVGFSFSWIMITYLLWSFLWMSYMLYSKLKWAKAVSTIPFWPFLAGGFFITIFYHEYIWNLIEIYFKWL